MVFKKRTEIIRVPKMFPEILGQKMDLRYNKKLAKRNERSNPEAIRLLMKTDGWKMSLKELEFKPKRRNQR